MKKIYYTSIILVTFFMSGITMAQGLKFGIGGGLSLFSDGNSSNTGYHVGAKLKLDIPLVPITPVAFVTYHFISESDLSGDFNQKIFSAGVGAEYAIMPGPIKPYIAVDLGFNNFGSVRSADSYSRTGIDVGAGAEVKIPFLFTLDGSIKYNMMNLFGKDSRENNLSAVVINVSILF